jgi:Tfp pilus assembly protein PilO
MPEKPTKQNTKKKSKDLKSKIKNMVPPFVKTWFLEYYMEVSIGIAIVVFLIGYALVLHPKLQEARDFSVSNYELELKEKEKLEEKLDYLVGLSSQRSRVSKSKIDKISEILPEKAATPQLITSVEGIAQESGVTIEGIEMSILDDYIAEDEQSIANPLPSTVGIVEFNLSLATGPYEQVKLFLENLENSLRILDVIALMYSPLEENYSIIFRSYFLE